MTQRVKELEALEQKKLETISAIEKQKQKIVSNISKELFSIFSKTNSLSLDKQTIAGLILFYQQIVKKNDQKIIGQIEELGATIFPSKKQIQEYKKVQEVNS